MLHVVICLPIHAIVLKNARGEAQMEAATDDPVPPLTGQARTKAMALFAAALALNGIVFSAISAHVVPLFSGLGFDGEEAVFMAALIGPSQVASRIGEILMGAKLKATHLGLIASGCCRPPSRSSRRAASDGRWQSSLPCSTGASNGLVTIAKGAVPLVLFGRKGYGEMLGILSAPNLVLNAAAPLAFALLLTVTSAGSALMIAGGAALASGLCMLWLARLHPR